MLGETVAGMGGGVDASTFIVVFVGLTVVGASLMWVMAKAKVI